jgi:uncharacterized protein
MKLHLARQASKNAFTGYGDGYLAVNEKRFETSLIVLPEQVIPDWEPRNFEGLVALHFEFIASLGPEVVLLGTGPTLRFPHPKLTQALAARSIGFEAMDTFAAARTYNILMAEGRKVAAALIL